MHCNSSMFYVSVAPFCLQFDPDIKSSELNIVGSILADVRVDSTRIVCKMTSELTSN